jgi:hypothetical protein
LLDCKTDATLETKQSLKSKKVQQMKKEICKAVNIRGNERRNHSKQYWQTTDENWK